MTFFAISCVLIFFASLGFGMLVYTEDKTSQVSKSWLRFSFVIAVWSLALLDISITDSGWVALGAQYILDISAIIIPVAFLHFTVSLLDIKMKRVLSIVDIAAVVMIVFSFTPWFKYGVMKNSLLGTFWIDPGPFYIIFPIYFLSVGALIIGLLIRSYFHASEGSVVRDRVRQLIFTVIFGTLGGITNFLPQVFGINPSAFGNIFMLLYIFFMSYAVLRYSLFDTKVIATRLFTGVLLLVLLTNILRSSSLEEWSLNFTLFVIVGIVSLLLSKSVAREVSSREKVEKLAKKLKKLNKKLKEFDEKKTEFLHVATHQLRGPVTAINGYAALMKDGDYGKVSKEMKEPIVKILSAGKVMKDTINDYMNIARIEENRLNQVAADFDLSALVRERADVLQLSAKEKGIELDLDASLNKKHIVHADKQNLTQVMNALLENAIKYTKKGSVRVKMQLTKDGKHIQVAVSDSGIGVAKKELDGLFDKFSRASNAKKANIFGTGMGLFIAKGLMKANGGSIKATSEGENKGTTFTIELPTVGA